MIFPTTYNRILVKTIGVLFIVLFVYAATSKLLDYETFTVQLAQSPLLSAYAGMIAWFVPSIEIAIALLLTIPRFRILALYAAFTLMVMFTAYIYIILNFSDFIPCSCGGVLEKLSWTQHLIFNIVFVFLAVGAIFLSLYWNQRIKLLLLPTLAIVAVGIVAILFAFSEKKMYRNNAFQRKYIPKVATYIRDLDLGTNNHYIAGFKNNIIYLGNYRAPLYLKTLTTSLDSISDFPVSINNMDLPYRRASIRVEPPYFFVGDGTVPIIFRGRIKDWKATVFSYDRAFFKQFEIADSTHIGIASISHNTNTTVLGLLTSSQIKDSVYFNNDIISKQLDGIFDTDGVLLWNERNKKFIYTYYYQNRYEVMDAGIQYLFSGKTIDTVSKPILNIRHHSKTDQYSKGGNTIVVNRHMASVQNYLLINSDRLGRYEDKDIPESAAIIDVYDIAENKYEFSFYLGHQPGRKLDGFRIDKNLLIALVDGRLWIYKLKPEYFNSGSNTTHTGQYQD